MFLSIQEQLHWLWFDPHVIIELTVLSVPTMLFWSVHNDRSFGTSRILYTKILSQLKIQVVCVSKAMLILSHRKSQYSLYPTFFLFDPMLPQRNHPYESTQLRLQPHSLFLRKFHKFFSSNSLCLQLSQHGILFLLPIFLFI